MKKRQAIDLSFWVIITYYMSSVLRSYTFLIFYFLTYDHHYFSNTYLSILNISKLTLVL